MHPPNLRVAAQGEVVVNRTAVPGRMTLAVTYLGGLFSQVFSPKPSNTSDIPMAITTETAYSESIATGAEPP
jgi:hypothetical protein